MAGRNFSVGGGREQKTHLGISPIAEIPTKHSKKSRVCKVPEPYPI